MDVTPRNGTSAIVNWVTLPGETNTVEGDLYIDQTGIWNNDLLAVTASYYDGLNLGEVRHAKHLADRCERQLHLHHQPLYDPPGGAADRAQQPAVWPLGRHAPDRGREYRADCLDRALRRGPGWSIPIQAGSSTYIAPDTLLLVPTNQPLYIVDYSGSDVYAGSEILKIPSQYFNPYVGDILAVQSGEGGESSEPLLLDIHWNPLTASFQVAALHFNGEFVGISLEKARFAPVDIPPVQE